mgnify:CR=1 FL=1
MLHTDRTIKCADCGVEFPFSAAEQEFFDQKGFRFPRRCKPCRQQKRDRGPGGGEGGGQPQRADAGAAKETWPATCSNCGAETTVPFKPDPARATFCRKCYAERKSARTR